MSGLEISLLVIIAILVIIIIYVICRIRNINASHRLHYDNMPIGLIRKNINERSIFISSMANDIIENKKISSLRDIGKIFSNEHANVYYDSLELLESQNENFTITVDGKEKNRNFHLIGNRVGDILEIWIEDSSLLAWLSQLLSDRENDLIAMQSLFDILPFPIWWRNGEDLCLSGCNKNYAKLLSKSCKTIISEQVELGYGHISENGKNLAKRAANSNFTQSESHYLVINGKRKLFDFNECRMNANGQYILGYAVDQTHMEENQSILSTYMTAHNQVLEMIGSAVSIYGADRRLKFFNSAYGNMWNFTEETLKEGMLLGEVLETLRSNRLVPEVIDFPAYKKLWEKNFTTIMETEEELLHLPDERTIRMMASPHPLGGLMLVFEDVTDNLALEQSYNSLIAVQQETINNLHEGVAVFGIDGRINVWNKAFSDIWHIPEKMLYNAPHISTILDTVKTRFIIDDNWEYKYKKFILSITNPKAHKSRITLVDGMVIDIANVPLPNGQCLVLYQDVSYEINVERTLADNMVNFEKENLKKIELLKNLSKKLHLSLHSIQDLVGILQTEVNSKLSIEQKKYITDIDKELNILLNVTGNDFISKIDS